MKKFTNLMAKYGFKDREKTELILLIQRQLQFGFKNNSQRMIDNIFQLSYKTFKR